MTAVTIPHPREDAKIVVKAAFENCSGIKTYHSDGVRIIGKTGASLGLIKSSYGEQVIVEIPEDQINESETMISVTGKREVNVNIGADPEKCVSQFIRSVNGIKDNDIDVILDVLSDNDISSKTKEVEKANDQADGSTALILIILLIMFFVIILPMMMI